MWLGCLPTGWRSAAEVVRALEARRLGTGTPAGEGWRGGGIGGALRGAEAQGVFFESEPYSVLAGRKPLWPLRSPGVL